MTRFVHLKNNCNDMLINTRAIVGVSNLDEETVTVELFDGTTHRVDRAFLHEIAGDDAIIQVYSCKHMTAVYENNDKADYSLPVAYMALTAAGNLRPMDRFFKFMDDTEGFEGHFTGFGITDNLRHER